VRKRKINETNFSVFIHEYIHFIQDISTYVGYNNLYIYSEYIHGAVNEIYKKPKGKIILPITFSNNYENIGLNQFINKTKTANLNDNYTKQDLLINKVKVDIISNKLNDFLLMISDNQIVETYTEDLSILEEVLKQFNTTYMGNNEMLGLLDTQTFVKFQEYLHTNLILINQKIAMYQLILTNFKESCEKLLNM